MPPDPALLLPPTITTLLSSILALDAFYYLRIRTKYTVNILLVGSSALLHLFSNSNSAFFVDGGGCKNISCPKAQGTLATPLVAGAASKCLFNEKSLHLARFHCRT